MIAPVRSLKNLPGIVEPALQRNHVAMDVPGNCASWEADQFGQFAYSG